MIDSTSLTITDVRLIGQQLTARFHAPFLCTSVTRVLFHSSGKVLLSKDLLNKIDKGTQICSAICLIG